MGDTSHTTLLQSPTMNVSNITGKSISLVGAPGQGSTPGWLMGLCGGQGYLDAPPGHEAAGGSGWRAMETVPHPSFLP